MEKKLKNLKFLTVGAVAGGLLLAGCTSGGESQDPKSQLQDAAQKLASASAMEVTISLDGDADALAATDTSSDPETTAMLLNSSVTVRYDQGESSEDTTDDVVGFDLNLDGTDMGSFIAVDETLYLQVDFEALKSENADLGAQLDSIEEATDVAPELASLKPLLAGEWVQLDASAGSPLGSLMGPSMTEEDSAQNQSAAEEMKAAVGRIFSDAEVTRDENDDKHLMLTMNAQEAYNELYPIFNEASGAASQLGAGAGLPDPSEVPNKDLTADVWVDGDNLERIEFDGSQLSEEQTERVAIVAEFGELDKIEIPSDAPVVDLTPIFGSMM